MTNHGRVHVDTDEVRANLHRHLRNSVPPDQLPAIIEETLYRFLAAVSDIAQHLGKPHRFDVEIPAYTVDGIKVVVVMPVMIAPINPRKEEVDG